MPKEVIASLGFKHPAEAIIIRRSQNSSSHSRSMAEGGSREETPGILPAWPRSNQHSRNGL